MPNDNADAVTPETLRKLLPGKGDFWVFGYGSLMWDPGFDHTAAEPALLHGYHRSFCMYSKRHRGTPARPGLVLALDWGGCCRGMAFRVDRRDAEPVLDYLWDREMVRYAYLPRAVHVEVEGERVPGITFVADRHHESYAGRLAPAAAAAVIRAAHGGRGSNRDYLVSTIEHLRVFGITAGPIHELLPLVDATG
jgi:cation transport protein ChaC